MIKYCRSILAVGLLSVAACTQPADQPEPTTRIMKYTDLGPPPAISLVGGSKDNLSVPAQRMIIKTGTLQGEVEDYDTAATLVGDKITSLGGFIVSSSVNTVRGPSRRGTIKLRVPSTKFDTAISTFTSLFTKMLSRSVSGNDVTEEFVDVTARLENKKRIEVRYREILRSAKSVQDILDVEKALGEVRGEIERFEARQKYLQDQVTLSTITIELVEPQAVAEIEGPSIWSTVGTGFRKGFNGFADMLSLSITIVISSIPVIVILAILVYLVYKLIVVYRSRRVVNATVPKDK